MLFSDWPRYLLPILFLIDLLVVSRKGTALVNRVATASLRLGCVCEEHLVQVLND